MTHTAVQIRCPMCALQTAVPAHKVRIYRCTNRSDSDFYAWVCPECDEPVTRRADVASACLLIAAGVPTVLYGWPGEAEDAARTARPWAAYEADDLALDIAALETAEDVA